MSGAVETAMLTSAGPSQNHPHHKSACDWAQKCVHYGVAIVIRRFCVARQKLALEHKKTCP
jgi:hypothetical protein